MSQVSKSGAVLFAKDPARVAAFYEAVVPMKVTHSSPDIIVLEAAGQQLMVHPIPAATARRIQITVPPTLRAHAATKLVFAVAGIAEVRARAAAFGGGVKPPQRMFEVRGFRACDGHDPEGNIIQFREDAAAPAKTVTRRKSPAAGVNYETVRALALSWPNVVDSSSLRGLSFKARGKLLACKAIHRSVEPESLMVLVGAAERDRLLAADPATYYLTPHYQDYDAVLVRLKRVDAKSLQSLFGVAWKFVTTASGARRPARRQRVTGVRVR